MNNKTRELEESKSEDSAWETRQLRHVDIYIYRDTRYIYGYMRCSAYARTRERRRHRSACA